MPAFERAIGGRRVGYPDSQPPDAKRTESEWVLGGPATPDMVDRRMHRGWREPATVLLPHSTRTAIARVARRRGITATKLMSDLLIATFKDYAEPE